MYRLIDKDNLKKERKYWFFSFFSIVYFFPLFPNLLENSQVHINFIIVFLSLVSIFLYKNNSLFYMDSLRKFFLLYYLVCQVLLVPSLITDVIGGGVSFTVFLSFFRPVLLYITFASMLILIEKMEFDNFITFLCVVILISFFYAILEVFFIAEFSNIIHMLYKREWRVGLEGVSTTFFMTSYFSGFIYYSIFILIFVSFIERRSFKFLLFSFLAFVIVILSQSKAVIFSTFISLLLLLILQYRRKALIPFLFSLIVVVIFFYNLDSLLSYFDDYNLRIIKQIKELAFNTSESETLNARSGQVLNVLGLASENYLLLGLGLTPDKSLESWVALFLYRYGFFGIICFLLLVAALLKYSYKLILNGSGYEIIVGKSLFVWGITLPITQMSSAMLELGKTGFITAIMFALLCIAIRSNKERN